MGPDNGKTDIIPFHPDTFWYSNPIMDTEWPGFISLKSEHQVL